MKRRTFGRRELTIVDRRPLTVARMRDQFDGSWGEYSQRGEEILHREAGRFFTGRFFTGRFFTGRSGDQGDQHKQAIRPRTVTGVQVC
jgi:hypothetical protein